MLRRLRDLFAHARAGHRIGCVWCDRDERARLVLLGMDFEQRVQKAIANSDARRDELVSESQKHSDSAGSPVDPTGWRWGHDRLPWFDDFGVRVEPEPTIDVKSGPPAKAHRVRPHTLYVADPDELVSESQKHSDSAGSPVDPTGWRGEW